MTVIHFPQLRAYVDSVNHSPNYGTLEENGSSWHGDDETVKYSPNHGTLEENGSSWHDDDEPLNNSVGALVLLQHSKLSKCPLLPFLQNKQRKRRHMMKSLLHHPVSNGPLSGFPSTLPWLVIRRPLFDHQVLQENKYTPRIRTFQ